MPSNGDFVLNVIKKVLNSQIKDQGAVLVPNYSLLNVWSVDIAIVLLSITVIVAEQVTAAKLIAVDT